MKHLFGTDGIRGAAGEFPLDPATVAASGAALVRHLISGSTLVRDSKAARAVSEPAAPTAAGSQPRILVGRDTRESGPWMQESLIAGIRRAGGAADPIGVVTTPGLAYLTGRGEYQA